MSSLADRKFAALVTQDVTLSKLVWSAITEPGDEIAGTLIASLGAQEAVDWLLTHTDKSFLRQQVGMSAAGAQQVDKAIRRWLPRLEGLDPRRHLDNIAALGGVVLTDEDPQWPVGLRSLGTSAPIVLWVRGCARLAHCTRTSVAMVGARAATAYGEHVASSWAAQLAAGGYTVVSGGAYGIDAAAHRGALTGLGSDQGQSTDTNCLTPEHAPQASACPSIAVMAGGVDRLYPPGQQALLESLCDLGAVVAEMPPGSAPFRSRFLARNRLIAAMTTATVVVEAAMRSGALNTARRASALLRPVGAVPGPVTSMASAGCHELLREGYATCVTEAAEVMELASQLGTVTATRPQAPDTGQLSADSRMDGLPDAVRRVFDALPLGRGAQASTITRKAGCTPAELLSALGVLEVRGLAQVNNGLWRKTSQR